MRKFWLSAVLLLLAGLVLSSVLCAAPLQNYSISYTYKNPDGSVFRVIKYYLRDGNKYRADYLSGDGSAYAIEILRKDKNLVWSADPSFKIYFEVALRQDAWDHAVTGIFAADDYKQKKTGQAKFLNYSCDTYEAVSGEWTNISVVDQGTNVILRHELKQNGKLVQTMEATEIRAAQPAATLFEVPAGYTKQQSQQPN